MSGKSKRPKARGSKRIHTHAVLHKIAKHALSNAESGRDGAMWDAVVVVLASAFMVEAHLNLVGAKLFSNWTEVDESGTIKERLSTEQKLRLICAELGMPVDGRSRRHRAFIEAFRVRKLLVHGRDEHFSGEWDPRARGGDVFKVLRSEWEVSCEPPRARQIYDELSALVTDLHRESGIGRFPFLRIMSGEASVP